MFNSRRSFAAASVLVAFGAVLVAPTGTWAEDIEPQACHSDQGWVFTPQSNNGLILDGAGNAKILHNGTNRVATLSMSHSASKTTQWAVNASWEPSAGFNFAIISASVSTKYGGSYSRSYYYDDAVSTTISVGPDRYGILQGGVFRRKVIGTYAYDTGNCTFRDKHTITAKLPKPANGFDTAENATGNVPWDA